MQPVQKLIGMNIKLARTKRSIAQAELASKIGIEASYLSRIERGNVPVSCERIYEVIHFLQCGISEIFPEPSEVETQFDRHEK
ncbi:transcriptional regulator [Pseudoalteromonas sp. NBT06-2]|uniref:helix-turn-helix domain-containing protein n=1 Tax=Pseudoalteromonas sp. NBT06-2 TaxID=2025950 RepID=UPI000BA77960|nr:helix-turn-helix transcriptional regulator [Pseudoalteromonas sp. NBT06-2]PAJ74338.1 transcriptional regulator [Pseudoalteromonas sp. NBT06-2]